MKEEEMSADSKSKFFSVHASHIHRGDATTRPTPPQNDLFYRWNQPHVSSKDGGEADAC